MYFSLNVVFGKLTCNIIMRVKQQTKPHTGPTLIPRDAAGNLIIARKSAPVTTGVIRQHHRQQRFVFGSFRSGNSMRSALRLLRDRPIRFLPIFKLSLREWLKDQKKSQRQALSILRRRGLARQIRQAVHGMAINKIRTLTMVRQAIVHFEITSMVPLSVRAFVPKLDADIIFIRKQWDLITEEFGSLAL